MTADLLMLAALLATWTWLRAPRGRDLYRLYLQSPGWWMTKAIRKKWRCEKCGKAGRLELHHDSYNWHNSHKLLRWIVPNLSDPMRTLCAEHHARAHGK